MYTKVTSMCVCIHTYTHVSNIRTYTCVHTYTHTRQLIDKPRTHSHSIKSVGIPRVDVINRTCNCSTDQIVAREPGVP